MTVKELALHLFELDVDEIERALIEHLPTATPEQPAQAQPAVQGLMAYDTPDPMPAFVKSVKDGSLFAFEDFCAGYEAAWQDLVDIPGPRGWKRTPYGWAQSLASQMTDEASGCTACVTCGQPYPAPTGAELEAQERDAVLEEAAALCESADCAEAIRSLKSAALSAGGRGGKAGHE
jgi:hypothetical protein